jgi:hypothetical protein
MAAFSLGMFAYHLVWVSVGFKVKKRIRENESERKRGTES